MIFFFSDPCSISGSFRVFFETSSHLITWCPDHLNSPKGNGVFCMNLFWTLFASKRTWSSFPKWTYGPNVSTLEGGGRDGPSSPNMGPPAWHQGEKKKGYRFRISGNWPLWNYCAQIWLVYATIEQLLKTNNTLHEISLKSVQFKTHSLYFRWLAYGSMGLSL